MSKKKGASRSAMTLKDFHGGSIPSDLPLPSAPGMTVDRSIFERQGSGTWMSPTLGRGFSNGRSGYQRQGSSGGVRTFEDKASYFPNPANIGRNYDEDERKPVDSRPRSSHSSDRFDDHAPYEERRGGGYPTDRYALEDQGSFGSAPSFSTETRSSGGASDRFPPSSQVVAGSGFESDIYVHDEFGLIPVGPPPSRVPLPQEPQVRPQPTSSYHRGELASEQQPSYVQPQQTILSVAPLYSPHPQQIATSPPRSWRNPSNQVQNLSSAATHVPPESATNVWTARRDGDVSRTPTAEPPLSDNLGSSPWRPHSMAGRALETRAVDKVSSGRWQLDSSRPSGANERRQQFAAPAPEQIRESIMHHKPSGAEYPPSEISQSRYEAARGLHKSDAGRGLQSSEAVQGASDEFGRISNSTKANRSQGGRGGALERGEFSDRAGSAEEQSGYGVDTLRQRYGEFSGGHSETERLERFISTGTDAERVVHSGTGRGGFSDTGGRPSNESPRVPYGESAGGINSVDDERLELIDQNKTGYRDTSRVGFGSGAMGLSSNGRFSTFDPVRSAYPDRTRYSEGGEGSLSTDGASRGFPENGRSPPGTAAGRESSRPAAVGEQAEIMERPKLKLLARSKPLEKIETANVESENGIGSEEGSKKGHSQSDDKRLPEVLPMEVVSKRLIMQDVGSTNDDNDEDGSRRVERPKLNLKPRSQPTEAESGEGSQKVRQLVFGGARPRELVLKERGVDDLLSGALDTVQTPVTASIPSSASSGAKWEQAEGLRVERPDTRADEKQDNWRHDRQERGFERQGSHRLDRQESSRADRGPDNKWDLEKESQWDQERVDGSRKRELDKQDNRRDNDIRRDIDKQESWRRPADPPVSNIGPKYSSSTLSSLVDPSPRASGRYGYSPTASAVELAQAFSRSTSIGSTIAGGSRGPNSLRSPLSPIPKSVVQGFAPGYGNGIASSHVSRDAPFSRLAEASPPAFSASITEMYLQGSAFGVDSQTNYYGSGKLGSYGSSDLKRGSSFGRPELVGRDVSEENDDFPGKRGLPVRQKDGYFD